MRADIAMHKTTCVCMQGKHRCDVHARLHKHKTIALTKYIHTLTHAQMQLWLIQFYLRKKWNVGCGALAIKSWVCEEARTILLYLRILESILQYVKQ